MSTFRVYINKDHAPSFTGMSGTWRKCGGAVIYWRFWQEKYKYIDTRRLKFGDMIANNDTQDLIFLFGDKHILIIF